ncbi:hypothetical protein V6G34_002018 [Vibrio parahaemolyticus]|nr:hypothetical protein [Vibrio parahaemolyticus]
MKDRTLIIDCNSVYLDNDEKCPLDKNIYRGADFLKADITSEDLTSLLSFYRSYETCILLPPTLLNFNNNIAKFREFMDRCTKPTMIKINSFEGKYSELNEYFIFLDFLSINLGRSVDIFLDVGSLGLEHNSDDRAALFNCYYEMKEINEEQYLGFCNKAVELNYNTLLMPRG